jgi:hypothetical protein
MCGLFLCTLLTFMRCLYCFSKPRVWVSRSADDYGERRTHTKTLATGCTLCTVRPCHTAVWYLLPSLSSWNGPIKSLIPKTEDDLLS